jgi:hypothetical protein
MLEEMLLSLKARDTISLVGESYKVKNIVSATDGTVLKAKLMLVKEEDPSICVNIDISTQIHRDFILRF